MYKQAAFTLSGVLVMSFLAAGYFYLLTPGFSKIMYVPSEAIKSELVVEDDTSDYFRPYCDQGYGWFPDQKNARLYIHGTGLFMEADPLYDHSLLIIDEEANLTTPLNPGESILIRQPAIGTKIFSEGDETYTKDIVYPEYRIEAGFPFFEEGALAWTRCKEISQ